jgi:hypothetical protein
MIISNSRRFIFLHLRKAAGSSLTECLSFYANTTNDYVVGAFVERFKSRRLPLSDFLLALSPPYHLSTLRYLQKSGNFLGFLNVNYKSKYYKTLGTNPEHSSLDSMFPLLDYPLSEYNIIVCIRDPIQRVISDYSYLSNSLFLDDPASFRDLTFNSFFEMYINPEQLSPFLPANRRLEDLLGSFISTIPASRLHFLAFDDLQNSLRGLCQYLFGSSSLPPLESYKKRPAQANILFDSYPIDPFLIYAAKKYFSLEYQILQNSLCFTPSLSDS